MIAVQFHLPSHCEAGALLRVDGSASHDTADPSAAATYLWEVLMGNATLEDATSAATRVQVDANATTDVTLRLTVAIGGSSANASGTMTFVDRIGADAVSLAVDLPDGLILTPRGRWFFDLVWTPADLTLAAADRLLASLSPTLIDLWASNGSLRSRIPLSIRTISAERWRCFVHEAPAGETVIERAVEQHKLLLTDEGEPYVQLDRLPDRVREVRAVTGGDTRTRIQPPWWSWSGTTVRLHSSYGSLAQNGQLDMIEVDYYHQDPTRQTGWYAALGLGPFDEAVGSLELTYNANGPSTAGSPQPIRFGIADVRLAGTPRLVPHHDVWFRDGDRALLRESYDGIVIE